jgi:ribonuclease VapC
LILDTSAVVAVVRDQPTRGALDSSLLAAQWRGIGAPTLAEAAIVLAGRYAMQARAALENFLEGYEVESLSFTDAHWWAALAAFERFGKGRHPARLNMGDCFSYATASIAGEPLLFVGDDFSKTDLQAVNLDSNPEGGN